MWFLLTKSRTSPRPPSDDAAYCSRVNNFIEKFSLSMIYMLHDKIIISEITKLYIYIYIYIYKIYIRYKFIKFI